MKGVELQELADVTVGHVGPMQTEYRKQGIPFLRSQNVQPHRIDPSDIQYIGSDFHSTLRKSALSPGDVVIVRTGKPGTAAVIPEWLPEANCSDLVVVRPGPSLDSRWLSYYINAAAQSFINAHLVGAVQQHFNVGSAKRLRLPVLGLSTQRAIAEVLGALDDKIAANDKLAGAADSLVRAVLGRTGGAGRVVLGDLFSNPRVAAKPPIKADSYVGLEHLPRRLMWLGQSGDADGLLSGKFWFSSDDVLFGKLRPYFHKVVVSDRQGVCSTDILVLRPLRTELKGYSWAAASSDGVVERVSAMSAGTRMPRTNWSDLAGCEVEWPGETAALELSERVVAIRDRVAAALAESRYLAELRDTLLPHLMSGRITVRDAEQQVEGVL